MRKQVVEREFQVSKKGSRFRQLIQIRSSIQMGSVKILGRRTLRLSSLFNHAAYRLDDNIWAVKLDVVRAVLRDRPCSTRGKMRQFLLHLGPLFANGLGHFRRKLARRLVRILGQHSQWQIAQRSCRGNLSGTLRECLQFLHSFTSAAKVALRRSHYGIFIAHPHNARNTERRGILQKFGLAQASCFPSSSIQAGIDFPGRDAKSPPAPCL